MRVHDGRLLGSGVGEAPQKLARALARGAAQNRVDQAMPAMVSRLGQLDRVGHDRTVGRAGEVEQLVQSQSQGGEHARIQAPHRPLGEALDEVVERAPALHGAICQAHRQAVNKEPHVKQATDADLIGRDELGIGIQGNESPGIAQALQLVEAFQVLLLLSDEAPNLIQFDPSAVQVPQFGVQNGMATLADPHAETHDGVPMNPGDALNGPDAGAFGEHGHHQDFLFGLQVIGHKSDPEYLTGRAGKRV